MLLLLSLSVSVMRRASEGVHASLVQQRKETKRVKEKVSLQMFVSVYLLILVQMFVACLFAALALG